MVPTTAATPMTALMARKGSGAILGLPAMADQAR